MPPSEEDYVNFLNLNFEVLGPYLVVLKLAPVSVLMDHSSSARRLYVLLGITLNLL